MKEDTKQLLARSGKYSAILLIIFTIMGFPYDASGVENMFFYMFGLSFLLILASGSLTLLFSEDTSPQYAGHVVDKIYRGIQSPDMISMDYAQRNNQAMEDRGNIRSATMPERLSALFLASLMTLLISIIGLALTGQ